MDKYRQNVKLVQDAIGQKCAPLQPNPYLAQRVLSAATGNGGRRGRKVSVGFAIVLALLMMSVTALAAVLLTGHDVKLYEGIDLLTLLPEQWQEYDVCHQLEQGYLIGGFSLDDDVISPMTEEDAIVMLDRHFRVRWTLTDERLEGCLFDKVRETGNALYMGMERAGEGWVPAVMKLNPSGVIDWLYEGQPDFTIKDFAVDAEGCVYGVGSLSGDEARHAGAFKLDPDGSVVWERSYADLPVASLTAAQVAEGRLILAGYAGSSAWIGELRPDGRIGWQRAIDLDAAPLTVQLQTNNDAQMVLSVTFMENESEEATTYLRYYVLDTRTLSR